MPISFSGDTRQRRVIRIRTSLATVALVASPAASYGPVGADPTDPESISGSTADVAYEIGCQDSTLTTVLAHGIFLDSPTASPST
ncbi:hypothetical protein [Nocardia carnea]|uniref:hypothetical protein n=1 Tax=Nocardia carnea TaxID=37328 RepID=UPI0024550968|nr:hypothetical protein [Nocardia carnea]